MSARVLVVDDLPVNVKLLEAKLLVEYYEVVTAKDGPSALEAVKEEMPDIVLLDLGIGGIRLPHFTAIIGWSDAGVHYQGTNPAGSFVSQKTFIRQWERAGNQFLLVTASP